MNSRNILDNVLSCLELFESGRMPLHQLASELKVLQDDIDGVDNAWLVEFDRLRSGLEEVNAIRLDEQYSVTDEYDSLVNERVKRLRAHISAR